MPLALSPLLSLVIVYLFIWPVAWAVNRVTGKCAYVLEGTAIHPATMNAAVLESTGLRGDHRGRTIMWRRDGGCRTSGNSFLNAVHWFTSGLVGFARGWNNAPKIAALGLIALKGPGGVVISFGVVTVAMAVGGLLGGNRVLETLSRKLTLLPLPGAL